MINEQIPVRFITTPHTFIDTNIYERQKFHFDNSKFMALIDLCSSQNVILLITKTVDSEVKEHIKTHFAEAFSLLRDARQILLASSNLNNPEMQPLLSKPNRNALEEIGIQAWEKFKTSCHVQQLPSSIIDSSVLLDMYFSVQPPFGAGAKRKEFPDAISTIDITSWHSQTKQKINIISHDNDFKNWCDSIEFATIYDSIEDFLDAANNTNTLASSIRSYINDKSQEIIERFEEELRNSSLHLYDNIDADVIILDIKQVTISKAAMLQIQDNHASIQFTFSCNFDGTVNGPDYDDAIWDSEEKEYAFLQYRSYDNSFEQDIKMDIDFAFHPPELSAIHIDRCRIENDGMIAIYTDHDY